MRFLEKKEGILMRILVISDSHRSSQTVEKIIEDQPSAEQIFFLGDVVGDIEDLQFLYPNNSFHIVSGNCDFGSLYKCEDTAFAADKKIFFAHGHTLGVKYGKRPLIEKAKELGCDIALYGHTHCPDILYEDGIFVVNPGSCSSPRNYSKPTYAVIDIEKNGIKPIIIEV